MKAIEDKERPLCQICGKSLVYHLSRTYYEEVGGWYLDCDCVDESQFIPDETFKFNP